MTHYEIIDLYPEYADRSLSRNELTAIDQHLQNCSRCRSTYQFLRTTLEPGTAAQRLTADPYLPTKIRSLATTSNAPRPFSPAVQWSLASLATGVAVTLGILMGSGISSPRTVSSTSTTIVDEFATSLTPTDLGDALYSAIGTNGGSQR